MWRPPLIGLLLGLLSASGGPLAQEPPAASADAEQRRSYAQLLQKRFLLEREKQLKEFQLELAENDAPYLLIDLADRQVHILVRATIVKSVPLLDAEIEGQRQMFSAAAPPPGWANQTFQLRAKSGDDGEPEKIQPGEPVAASDDEEVNPRSVTPDLIGLGEEPVYPDRFTLLFQEGLAVSIGGGSANGQDRSWASRSWERLSRVVLVPSLPEVPDMRPAEVWIHLVLPREDARDLYPSLFTDMRAMIRLPGDPRI